MKEKKFVCKYKEPSDKKTGFNLSKILFPFF